jgi:hypothetical protein
VKVSNKQTLEFEQFLAILPLLGQEFACTKLIEMKNKLNQIEKVMKYPESVVSSNIEKLINGVSINSYNGVFELKIENKK